MRRVSWGLFVSVIYGVLPRCLEHESYLRRYAVLERRTNRFYERDRLFGKDWGTSFPAAYIWVQCNSFDAPDVRFFSPQPTFPLLVLLFGNDLCSASRQPRISFATYHGAKIHDVKRTEDRLVIQLKQNSGC